MAFAIQIAASGEWFQASEGSAPISLKRRHNLRRVLKALVEKRLQNTVLSTADAFDRGWPGERAFQKAAAMRVYTAMCTLRREGLRDLICRRSDGYVLLGDFSVVTEERFALAS